MHDEKVYVLDKGSYGIQLAKHVHEPVTTLNYTVKDRLVYKANSITEVTYENKFEDTSGNVTFLSRSDWDFTYPDDINYSNMASDELLKAVKS